MARLYLRSPAEVAEALGERARTLRLAMGLTQATLAERSRVGLRTLQRFEKTGVISVDALIRIAFALGVPDTFDEVFPAPPPKNLDEALGETRKRKKGRK